MSRPFKCRKVCFVPGVTYFKPAGIPLRMLEENCLSLEEMEAVRLRDLEHLEQQQCAERMSISRPTFQRVLASARKKIADSLYAGKALRIEGGNYELVASRFRCSAGHEWETGNTPGQYPSVCPIRNTANVLPHSVEAMTGSRTDRSVAAENIQQSTKTGRSKK